MPGRPDFRLYHSNALDVLGEHPSLAMVIGAGVALVWAGTGFALGRSQQRREGG